jgi:hypothetical protein
MSRSSTKSRPKAAKRRSPAPTPAPRLATAEAPAGALPPAGHPGLLYRWFAVYSAREAAGDAEDIARFVLRNYGLPAEVRQGLLPPDAPAGNKDPLAALRRLLADIPVLWDPTLAPYGLRFGYPETPTPNGQRADRPL